MADNEWTSPKRYSDEGSWCSTNGFTTVFVWRNGAVLAHNLGNPTDSGAIRNSKAGTAQAILACYAAAQRDEKAGEG